MNVTKTFFYESYAHVIVQELSDYPLTVEAKVQIQASPHGICGGRSCTWMGFFFSLEVGLLFYFLSLLFHKPTIDIDFIHHCHVNLAV